MTGRAKNGQKGQGGRLADDSEKKRQKPLPFIINIVNDPAQPMALRAQMARAALPYLHERGEDREQDESSRNEPTGLGELLRELNAAEASLRASEGKVQAVEERARKAAAQAVSFAHRACEAEAKLRALEDEIGPRALSTSSLPHSLRPSTSLVLRTRKQDVDGRHEAGHDVERACARTSK